MMRSLIRLPILTTIVIAFSTTMISACAAKLPKEPPKERSKEVTKEVAKDAAKDTPKELAKEPLKEATKEVAKPTIPALPEIDRIEDGKIYFKPSPTGGQLKPLTTSIADLKYLGTVSLPNNESPYLILSGRQCANCDDDKNIIMIKAEGGNVNQFVYPGRIIDSKTRQVVFEGQSFFGKCLPPSLDEVYVIFQRERVDRRGMPPSVFVARPGRDHIDERLIERHMPKLKPTMSRVKAGLCHKIEGRNRHTLKKPLDLTPRSNSDDDEDDEDEDAKKPAST